MLTFTSYTMIEITNFLICPTEFQKILTSRKVRIANEILMHFRAQKKSGCEVSINETIDIDKDGNPLTYMDIISIEESMTENIELEDHIKNVRELVGRVLTPREEEIVVLRYGLKGFVPKTQREVAKHLGISRSYVSRIEKKALEKLKSEFGSNIPSFDF